MEAAEEDNHPAEDNRPAEDSRPVGDSPAGEGSRPGDSTLGWTLLLLVFVVFRSRSDCMETKKKERRSKRESSVGEKKSNGTRVTEYDEWYGLRKYGGMQGWRLKRRAADGNKD